MILSIITTLISIFTASTATITHLVNRYGYYAIFGLMLLEGSSLPVPSEVILPLAGLLVHEGLLSFPVAVFAAVLGSIGGLIIDYYIGYFLGKEVVYKHLALFHIKRQSLEKFDQWFERNGTTAVFASRLIPIARTWMSFPAGFAKMNQKKFFAWSILGTTIWDVILVAFGFYFLGTAKAIVTLLFIALLAIGFYAVYRLAMGLMPRKRTK